MNTRRAAVYARTAMDVWREKGPVELWHRTLRFVHEQRSGRRGMNLSVDVSDVLQADWTDPAETSPSHPAAGRSSGPFTINWVIPPSGKSSGGHNTILQLIHHLELKGHRSRVYVYDPATMMTFTEALRNLRGAYQAVEAPIRPYERNLPQSDATFATSWPTAYAVYNQRAVTRRFYLVQDFEALFYPAGSESILAENTYRFGFHAITSGRWLLHKLRQEYGMNGDFFDQGSMGSIYRNEDRSSRSGIVFYARPVTPRRGFELGVLALTLFHRLHPDRPIHMVGWDVEDYRLPFPFISHGIVDQRSLNSIYNECAAALVLSTTNLSNVPLELVAAGCIPVVNDGPNNRMVTDNPFIRYTRPSPHALARALAEIVTRDDLPQYARAAARTAPEASWEVAAAKVESVLTRELCA